MALSQVDVNILTVLIVNVILFLVSIIVFFLIVKNRKSVIKRFLSYIRIPTSSQPERTVAPTPPHEGSPTSYLRLFGVPIVDKQAVGSLIAFFRMSSVSDVLRTAGHEAAVYMIMQRALIVFFGTITIVSMGVVLPVHVTASGHDRASTASDEEQDTSYYAKTTVDNVIHNSNLLWLHATCCVAFVLVGVGCLIYFARHPVTRRPGGGTRSHESDSRPQLSVSGSVSDSSSAKPPASARDAAPPKSDVVLTGKVSEYSVLVKGLPASVRNDEDLSKHVLSMLQSSSGAATVSAADIVCARLAFDVREIAAAHEELTAVHEKLVLARGDLERSKTKQRPRTFCSQAKWPFLKRVDAIDHYSQKEQQASDKLAAAHDDFMHDAESAHTGFVVFSSTEKADRVVTTLSSVLDVMKVGQTKVKSAPEPNDIMWQNLGMTRGEKTGRILAAHAMLVMLLLFFSTPLAILHAFTDVVSNTKNVLPPAIASFLFAFAPSLLLYLITLLLPSLIRMLTEFEGHRLKSTVTHRCLVRNFVYLLLSSLVLPTISLTLIDAIHEYEQTHDMGKTLSAAFLPESGLFFLAYVIQAAFLGNALDLLRVGESFWKLITTKRPTNDEEATIMNRMAPFEYAVHIPVVLTTLAVALTYSLFTPLIVPIGLFFIVAKHLTDQYNIMSVHPPSDLGALETSIKSYIAKIRLFCIFFISMFLVFQTYVFYFFTIRSMFAQATFVLVALCIGGACALLWYIGIFRRTLLAALELRPLLEHRESLHPDYVQLCYVCPLLHGLPPYAKVVENAEPSSHPSSRPHSRSGSLLGDIQANQRRSLVETEATDQAVILTAADDKTLE